GGVGSDGGFDVRGIDGHRGRIAVDELRTCTSGDDGGGCREEGVRGYEDLTAVDRLTQRRHRPQWDLDRARPRVDRDGVLRAVVGGEALLELTADGTERQLSGGQRLIDATEDLRPVFRRKMDLRRGHGQGHGCARTLVS